MTAEEIDSMPDGIEMNMVIAERVMGWKHYPDDLWERMKDWLTQRREFGWDERTPDTWKARMMITPEGESRWPPNYSTDISSAWVVRKALSERGIVMVINNRNPTQRACYGYRRELQDTNPEWSAIATTDSLAICRLALKTTL